MRPHLFEQPVTVTLCHAAARPGAVEIRYTLDGETPTAGSPFYTQPIIVRIPPMYGLPLSKDRAVCLESEGTFARLGPMPPAPEVQSVT